MQITSIEKVQLKIKKAFRKNIKVIKCDIRYEKDLNKIPSLIFN